MSFIDHPLPNGVHEFLWKQISPFVKPKFGKHHEASCVFCQNKHIHNDLKEACKVFEKILVQNITFDTRDPIYKQIRSIPRWELIQSSFPHVVHCIAAILQYRKGVLDLQSVTQTESKLLYILHWMVLDAGQECSDGDYEKGIYHQSPYHYLFSISSITLFVHLLAPLLNRIKQSDLQSFRLESGLALWQALWEYRHPDSPCFTTYAKLNPRHIWLTDGRMRRLSNNTIIPGRKRSDDGPFKGSDSSPSNSSSYHYSSESHISDRQSSATNQKDKSQKTTVQEYPHGAGEHMVIFRLPSLPESDTLNDSPTIFSGKASILQLAMGRTAPPRSSLPCEQLTIPQDIKHHMARHSITSAGLRTNKDMTETIKAAAAVKPAVVQDLRSATIMDVAVVRCLFLPQWSEEGIHWALSFIYRRLQNMNENATNERKYLIRRNSVPSSKINITLKNGNFDPKIKDLEASTRKDIAGFIFAKNNNVSMENDNTKTDRVISKSKLEDLKKFLEAKLISNSEKNLEKFHQLHQRSLDKEESKHSTHPTTSLSKILTSEGDYDLEHLQNLLKGSSMPSLSCLLEKIRNDARIGETKSCTLQQPDRHHYPNPIITITQHTPNPSPEYLRRKNSGGIAMDNLSYRFHKKPKVKAMVRSASDSSINYRSDSLYEAPGSIGFITEDGDLDIEVVLKAMHNVAQRERSVCSIRVCESILNILNLLTELGILKEQVPTILDNQSAKNTKKVETFDDIITANTLMTSCVFRIIKHLGCPNHCETGQKPTTLISHDLLRSQCQTLLSTLRKTNLEDFNNFLRHFMNNYHIQEILDFFHSFLGYCVDPNSLLSPNQKRNSKSADSVNQNTYANNFGFALSTVTTGKAIEAQIISSVFKNTITRLRDNSSQFKAYENMGTHHEVRMFINYVKEVYGGVFRRAMLSGLLDTVIKEDKKETDLQTTRVIRHVPQSNQETEVHADSCFVMDSKETKRALLKKKSTSSACANLFDGDMSDDSKSHSPHGISRKKHQGLIHRSSERNFTHISGNRNQARSPMTGIVNWFRKEYGRSESFDSQAETSDSPSDSVLVQQITSYSYSGHQQHKGTSSVGQTLHKAKKKVGDQLNRIGFKRVKKKDKSLDDSQGSYFSRRNSIEIGTHSRDSEIVILKERKLVSIEPLFKGMQRLSFLLELCHPGTIPDTQLMAAILDLPHTPVISRAAFIMECSYYVHCCNKGQWPTWMKISLPGFRTSGPRGSAAPNGIRRLQVLQKSAGKTFYSWAEAIGSRLQEMLIVDKQHIGQINSTMLDSNKHAELLLEDEEEDFLDEATVTQYGSECPLALRMMACNLLLEITAYLRDVYQNLPKSLRTSARDKNTVWDKTNVREANRRFSVALSSMGQSQVSAQSLQSIACDKETGKSSRRKLPMKQMTLKMDMTSEEGTSGRAIFQKYVRRVLSLSGERKISFILHEPDNGSEDSGNTNLINQAEEIKMQANIEEKKKSRPSSGQNRPFLLRRSTAGGGGGGSFKKRSVKLKKANKDTLKETPLDCDIKRVDSIQSKRQKGSLSDRSDTSEQCGSGEESPGIAESPDEQPPESPTDSNDTDDFTSTHMPWIKVMGEMMNIFNYHCTHQSFCHPFCYRRHIRASERLTRALRKVYGEEFFAMNSDNIFGTAEEKENKYQKASTTTSTQPSPIRRKNSLQKKAEKILSRSTEGMQSIHSRESTKDVHKVGQSDETHCSEGEYEHLGTKTKEQLPILKYIKSQVRDAFYTPLATIVKAAVILNEEHVADIMSVAWFLLLESNQEVSSCAASLFIIAAFKASDKATQIMTKGLHNSDASTRILSILRFQVLWTHRYHAWPRMEDRANLTFKLPPPAIEFTFTSPKIGIECCPIVDPPWMPVSDKVAVDKFHYPQESHRSFISATRKKDKREAMNVTYDTDNERSKNDRESFQISSVPVIMQAAYEPNLSHGFFGDADYVEDDEENTETQRTSGSHSQYINYLFPSCLCASVVEIINLLPDVAVSLDGNAVYEVAYQVVWNCLVEDSSLFFRHMLERLTRDKQDTMFRVLRRLIRFVPKLPQQAAFALYNHIIGYVMFYVRSPHEDGQKMIGAALSVLWMVVHSVHGIMFKDLKQILRKEQCDASILLTANVPSTKKIIVHGPQENIKGGIPSQFSVSEDTLFYHIWHESMSFFGIEESEQYQYFLVDQKTRQIHNLNNHIRDYYFFKRSQYPELEVVHLDPEKAFNELQEQELIHKFIEIGKVLLTWAILKNVDMVVQRVVFLHEELMKLPSFPRKALEVHFDLYQGGHIGKELQGLDVLHKFMWVRLIARMFEAMAGNFAYSGDIHLFLNVLNGTLILYGEDACILRYVTATYINAALNFKNIFSTNGYFLIIPTLLQLYSTHRSNKLITTTVEYTVKQFYLVHRKPFILQMFGSASSILDVDDSSDLGNANKVEAKCLFRLLLSLETPSPDPLNIGELVKADQPLKPTDLCKQEDDKQGEMVYLLNCILLCITVVAYSPESVRASQMLVILQAIIPCYLKQIQLSTYRSGNKSERDIIADIAVCVKTLVSNCESLTKSYVGPQPPSPDHKTSSQKNFSRAGPCSPSYEDEQSKGVFQENDLEESEPQRVEFRKSRDVLLATVVNFVTKCNTRLIELNKRYPSDGKYVELLNTESYVRLAEIAHSLLKMAVYDPSAMSCRGLQIYMMQLFPFTDWSAEDGIRQTFNNMLRRLEKIFKQIHQRYSVRRTVNWDAACGLIKGLYETMSRYPLVVTLPQVKGIILSCQLLMMGDINDVNITKATSGCTISVMTAIPSTSFCSITLRLTTLQILCCRKNARFDESEISHYSLEEYCQTVLALTDADRINRALFNFFIPLCLRVSTGRTDVACILPKDINYMLKITLETINLSISANSINQYREAAIWSLPFACSHPRHGPGISCFMYQVGFLALKILIVCFEASLETRWIKIVNGIREANNFKDGRMVLWDFIEFAIHYKTSLFIHLLPFIHQMVNQEPCDDREKERQQRVRENMLTSTPQYQKSRGCMVTELDKELNELKTTLKRYEEIALSKHDERLMRKQQEFLMKKGELKNLKRYEEALLRENVADDYPQLEWVTQEQRASYRNKTSEIHRVNEVVTHDQSENITIGKLPKYRQVKTQSRRTFNFRKSRIERSRKNETCVGVPSQSPTSAITRLMMQTPQGRLFQEWNCNQGSSVKGANSEPTSPQSVTSERTLADEVTVISQSSSEAEKAISPQVSFGNGEDSMSHCTSSTNAYRESLSLIMAEMNSPLLIQQQHPFTCSSTSTIVSPEDFDSDHEATSISQHSIIMAKPPSKENITYL